MNEIRHDSHVRVRPSAGRFVGIVAVFTLLGPPVGAIVVTGLLSILASFSELSVDGWQERTRMFSGMMLLGIVFGLPLSYLAGGISALMTGLATAFWDARKGVISLPVAMGGGLVLGLLAASRQGDLLSASEGEGVAQIAMLLAHLAAAAVCYLVARAIFTAPDRPKLPEPGESR